MKRTMLILAFAALLVLSSCSDEKTKPSVKDSDAVMGTFTAPANDMMSAPGVIAMETNSAVMDYLPFGAPIKKATMALGAIEKNEKIAEMNMLKSILPEADLTKQEERFIFADHLGTYTCTMIYTYTDSYGEVVVYDADWDIDLGGTNITMIIPADVALDGKKFEAVLKAYEDEYLDWYDSYQYYWYDYFPTKMDFVAKVNDAVVFSLDFQASWIYVPLADEVMPSMLNLALGMTPFSYAVTYTMEGPVVDFDMTVKKNNVQIMSASLDITFTDQSLTDLSRLSVSYTVNNYTMEFFIDSDFIALTENEYATVDDAVDMVNNAVHVYLRIKEGNTVIGRLRAKKSTEYDGYQTYEYAEMYIQFTDGSIITDEELAEMFYEFDDFVK